MPEKNARDNFTKNACFDDLACALFSLRARRHFLKKLHLLCKTYSFEQNHGLRSFASVVSLCLFQSWRRLPKQGHEEES